MFMTSKKFKSSFYNFNSLLPFSIMDRYLASELLPPFLFGVGTFSSLGITIDVMFELIRKIVESGLPVGIAINVFLLKLPNVIVYAFPLSTLLATLMTYSRLSSESELIALRGCGVSVYRMVLTAVVLSFLVTGMTFVFNERIVPAANYQATMTLQKALKGDKPPVAQQDNFLYAEKREVQLPDGNFQKVLARLYYADQFDGSQFKGLTIIDRSEKGVNQIIVARAGEWNPSQNIWDIYNGTIYLVAPDRSYRNIVRFKHQEFKLPRTAFDLAEKTRDYGEMNIAQALQQLQIVRLSGDEQKIRKLEVRIQQKVALPFVCVVFGLVGAAMGTIPQRTGRATSFGVSIIVIFAYYLLYFISGAVAETGLFPPFVGAWLPDFFGLAVGILLLRRVAQR
jgi:lipopolysaccharide export system permease protein